LINIVADAATGAEGCQGFVTIEFVWSIGNRSYGEEYFEDIIEPNG